MTYRVLPAIGSCLMMDRVWAGDAKETLNFVLLR